MDGRVCDLPFNMRLLLAPFTLDKLNRETANKILSNTFEFLSKLSRVFLKKLGFIDY